MTREEAIKYFENSYAVGDSDDERQHNEAVSMAISALSEELSEDGTLTVHVSDGSKVNRVLVMGDNIFGGLYYPDSAENKGDLISRQAVLYELKKWDWQDLYLPIHFKQILDDVPSADVRPNIHAYWMKDDALSVLIDIYRCSNCSSMLGAIHYNFCPNCGADMRGNANE